MSYEKCDERIQEYFFDRNQHLTIVQMFLSVDSYVSNLDALKQIF